MYALPEHLHRPHTIGILEPQDVVVLGGGFMIFNMADWKVVFVLVPLFWKYLRIKEKKPRGWILHWMYILGFAKIKGYPTYMHDEFYE